MPDIVHVSLAGSPLLDSGEGVAPVIGLAAHIGGRELFVPADRFPTSRTKLAARRVLRMHPAQIADLVVAASHEELDDEHQVEFLRDSSDQEAAAVLARMDSDDAADPLLELEQDRRLPILNAVPASNQRKMRALLGFNPSTAGGMMNPDFVSPAADTTVANALARVRVSHFGLRQLAIVCVVDDAGKLIDTLSLAELVRAGAAQKVSELVDDFTPSVATEADMLMSDFNLIAMPVLDAESRPVGIIGVDDVLELLLPEEWRWRAGAARDRVGWWRRLSGCGLAGTARRPRSRSRSCSSAGRPGRRCASGSSSGAWSRQPRRASPRRTRRGAG